MTKDTVPLNKALLVFARHLVDEMRYTNYPHEWSHAPLKDLLPKFFNVLNYHPDRLGDILQNAYNRTFPKTQRGNINQLDVKMVEPTKEYELFGKTRDYYLDEFETTEVYSNVPAIENDELSSELKELFKTIVNTFAQLTPPQENEHRTLERVCFALAPVYAHVQGMEDIGSDLAEYADQWRHLESEERLRFANQLIS